MSAYRRSRYFATFGVTTVGNCGVDSLRPLAPHTSCLHYGSIDPLGRVTMRLTFDHRVMDGSTPAKALVEMERFLHTDILAEVKALQAGPDPSWLKAG
jgi:pyruvate/2-oxoglutarate dehydrogenase complex dihydrolipoamide acyltransferase (E2) component